jgi:orotidine-5'-phosphate decarboxylase
MQTLAEAIRSVPKHIPIIADAKRGDIGNTAKFCAKAIFSVYRFDAVTVNPYGGRESVQPFLDYPDRGVFVWCRSSGPGAADFQDLELADGRTLYEAVARQASEWNASGNVGLVMGATWPDQLDRVRDVCPGMQILVPGVGSQEGDLEAAVQSAMDDDGGGFLINTSRSVLYASKGDDYPKAARKEAQKLRGRINLMREAVQARADAPSGPDGPSGW